MVPNTEHPSSLHHSRNKRHLGSDDENFVNSEDYNYMPTKGNSSGEDGDGTLSEEDESIVARTSAENRQKNIIKKVTYTWKRVPSTPHLLQMP